MSTETERSLAGRAAANESWARTVDRSARTAPARAAMMAKFEAQVDPEGTLPPEERVRRAESARRAHFQRLALKSAQARRSGAQRKPAAGPARDASPLLAEAHAWATQSPSPLVPAPTMVEGGKRVALYRHYDAFGVLLYVGITAASPRRLHDHARDSQWVQFAEREEAVWYPNRADAEAAEQQAIKIECPVFNKAHALPGRPQRVVAYLLGRGATDVLAEGKWT